MLPRCARVVLGVAACVSWAVAAHAHFPISRGVAVAPQGTVAIALPGFGLAVRPSASESFAYACDALLGIAPSDLPPAMAFTADGSLLVGSASGLRSIDANGCPRPDAGGELQRQPVARIAVHPARPTIVYAVTEGTLPRVWRSADGGTGWEERGSLAALNPVTALVLDPSDTDTVYVSQTVPGEGSSLRVSNDGGASFAIVAQKPALTLLDVEPAVGDAGTARFWAVGRSATAMGIQGFSLFAAASPSGPWGAVHDVRFFGGFARDTNGTLWIGDEAGGVYRSTDGGGSFTNVSQTTAVSCLTSTHGALWGCTPGLAEQTALVTWNDTRQAFDGVVALANVTRMVDCSPEAGVAAKCAAAWIEWQRDILVLPPSPRDAGAGTGGSPPIDPGPEAGRPPAGPVPSPEASPAAEGGQGSSSGCAVAKRAAAGRRVSWMAILASGALCASAARRRFSR